LHKKRVESSNPWLVSLLNVEYLLDDFKFTIIDRVEMYFYLERQFQYRCSSATYNKIYFDQQFRKYKNDIDEILHSPPKEQYSFVVEALKRRSGNIGNISIFSKRDYITTSTMKKERKIIQSLIHMSLNRLFKINQNQNELFVYAMLRRYHENWICRNKYSPTSLREKEI
jgi:thiopeptide-type bacteriocin biosynthesis protein